MPPHGPWLSGNLLPNGSPANACKLEPDFDLNIYICIKDSFRQVDTLAIGEMLSVFEPIHRRVGIGTGKFLAWIIGKGVAPHITVRDQSLRDDGTFSRSLSQ